MGFLWVRERYGGRALTFTEGLERRWTRVFEVRTDGKLVGPGEVVFAADPDSGESIPLLYSSYRSYRTTEVDNLALCRSITPAQDADDWLLWTVTCEYSTESPRGLEYGQPSNPGNPTGSGGSGSGASGDPTLDPPTVDWSFWTREEAQRLAYLVSDALSAWPEYGFGQSPSAVGTPEIDLGLMTPKNSAGQPFEGLTREVGGRQLNYERSEASFDSADMAMYAFCVNADRFLEDGDERTWLCRPITATKQYKGGLVYWRVKYEFHHNPAKDEDGFNLGWDHYLLNAGFKYWNAAQSRLLPIMEGAQQVTTPAPLNRNGSVMDRSTIIDPSAGPVFRRYTRYGRLPFAPLNIVL